MGFLNTREMTDYNKNTCSSSEYEEMVDSDIDLDGNFNTNTEMGSKNEHETYDGNKTVYTEYQELPIIKVNEFRFGELKSEVNEDVITVVDTSWQEHEPNIYIKHETQDENNTEFTESQDKTKPEEKGDMTLAASSSCQKKGLNINYTNKYLVSEQPDQEITGIDEEFRVSSLLQRVNILSKKSTVSKLPVSNFFENECSIANSTISTALKGLNIKTVDLSAIEDHTTFRPREVFGVCPSKKCKESVHLNPYIKIPRCDENIKLINNSCNEARRANDIQLTNGNKPVLSTLGDRDSDGDFIGSSQLNYILRSKQFRISSDLEPTTANTTYGFKSAGFRSAKRHSFSNKRSRSHKRLVRNRKRRSGTKPYEYPLEDSTLQQNSPVDSDVDVVYFSEKVDDDSDLEVDIVAEWDSSEAINKMRENINRDHNYIPMNNGITPLDQNNSSKNQNGVKVNILRGRIQKKAKKSYPNLALTRKPCDIQHHSRDIQHHNCLERLRRLEMKNLFNDLNSIVTKNPSPRDSKIRIIRLAENEIQALKQRQHVLLEEKRLFARLVAEKKNFITQKQVNDK
ncbi:uncharacterized protein LOC127866039 isoform X3 [Dreissena polymorpha]|uniref:BHLH domain-containing protein n=1 Tax=Dreissena polymorpha TaxID=45954 RepID=A0A9D4LRU9_DREPO|nr:uncharacterized protein LOC127866039 isoform X3 [Dreissena polymorpha]KAH3861746.1 hypothetical protein DPMN_024680 [Dreissena polymorpha]